MSKRRMNGEQPSHPIYLWNGILEPKHIEKIGPAIWLFLWLINATTEERRMDDGEYQGWVYGGKPLKFAELAGFLSASERSIRRHVDTLFEGGYIDLLLTPHGYQFRVRNSCRWPEAQAKGHSVIKAKDGASFARTAKMARQVVQKWPDRSSKNGRPCKNDRPKMADVSQDKPVDSWIKQLDEPGDKPAAHGAECVPSLKEILSKAKPEEKTVLTGETQEQKIRRQANEVLKQNNRARVYSPSAPKESSDAFIQSIVGKGATA